MPLARRPACRARAYSLRRLLLAAALLIVGGLSAPPRAAADPSSEYLILRDAYGVPHIYASTLSGLFRGQGYAVAQDRLWQMDINSRTGLGTLADLLGNDYLPIDRYARRHGYTQAELDSMFLALRPETQQAMDAYVAGVNDWIAEVNSDPAAYGPYEYWELGEFPQPDWTHLRVMGICFFVARTFGSAGGHELTRLEELKELGPVVFDLTYPVNDPSAPTTILPGDELGGRERAGPGGLGPDGLERWLDAFGRRIGPGAGIAKRESDQARRLLEKQLGLPPKFGSFAVTVGTNRTASGYGLLLGAPQTGPWPDTTEAQFGVEVDLQGAGFHVAGMTAAGFPGIMVGRNRDLAWSLTSGISDNMDIFVETLSDSYPNEYYYQGEWLPMESRVDTIFVDGRPRIYFPVERTVHGPVFQTDSLAMKAFTLKRAYAFEECRFLECLLDVNRAATVDEVAAALPQGPISFNVLCAARSGEVGYWHTGWLPERAAGVDPRLPTSGEGDEEWQGILPFSALPQSRDPSTGYFANWNNKPSVGWDQGDNVPWIGFNHVEYIFQVLDPIPAIGYPELSGVPHQILTRGTYEQMADLRPTTVFGRNILPPGESGFIDQNGVRAPHFTDQQGTYELYGYKPWIFEPASTDVTPAATPAAGPEGALRVAAFPSPGADRVVVSFRLPRDAPTRVTIHDAAGRRVRTISDGLLHAGSHDEVWDRRDDAGKEVAPGLYFARVVTPDGRRTVKLVLSP